jgi:hypothetical protein
MNVAVRATCVLALGMHLACPRDRCSVQAMAYVAPSALFVLISAKCSAHKLQDQGMVLMFCQQKGSVALVQACTAPRWRMSPSE